MVSRRIPPTKYPSYTGTEPCTESDNPDYEWFAPDDDHPERQHSGHTYKNMSAAAKTHCGRCPQLETCMRYAVSNKEPAGIWGGTTPAERKVLRQLSVWPSWDAVQNRWMVTTT